MSLQTTYEAWWGTLVALLALEKLSYLALKAPILLLLSQSVMGPRLFTMGGIIWRLASYSVRFLHQKTPFGPESAKLLKGLFLSSSFMALPHLVSHTWVPDLGFRHGTP